MNTNEDTMDAATLRFVVAGLGLEWVDFARWVGVNRRTVMKWASGESVMSAARAAQVWGLVEQTDREVEVASRRSRVPVYTSDEDFHKARPDLADLPVSWWERVAFRACDPRTMRGVAARAAAV